MNGVRCLRCGATRWSFTSRSVSVEPGPCELCGGPTTVERRFPGHDPARLSEERRGAREASSVPLPGVGAGPEEPPVRPL